MLKSIRSHIVNEFGTHAIDRFLLSLAGDESNWTIARRYRLSLIRVSYARKHGLELWALGQAKRRAIILPLAYRRTG